MPELGRKYTCYSCHTKFYDLGKPVPLCPKCNADQREADDAPVYTAPRSRRVVEEPAEEEDFTPAGGESNAESEDEEFGAVEERPSDDEADEEEEEY